MQATPSLGNKITSRDRSLFMFTRSKSKYPQFQVVHIQGSMFLEISQSATTGTDRCRSNKYRHQHMLLASGQRGLELGNVL